jgi:hypothetical protein
MTHFHTLFGIPGWGLEWTEEPHTTAREAWASVGSVLRENWQQDRPALLGNMHTHRNVAVGYADAAALCLTLEEPGRFHIPGLSPDDNGLTYGVVSCESAHLKVVAECSHS